MWGLEDDLSGLVDPRIQAMQVQRGLLLVRSRAFGRRDCSETVSVCYLVGNEGVGWRDLILRDLLYAAAVVKGKVGFWGLCCRLGHWLSCSTALGC